jgi:hypothetical protein
MGRVASLTNSSENAENAVTTLLRDFFSYTRNRRVRRSGELTMSKSTT